MRLKLSVLLWPDGICFLLDWLFLHVKSAETMSQALLWTCGDSMMDRQGTPPLATILEGGLDLLRPGVSFLRPLNVTPVKVRLQMDQQSSRLSPRSVWKALHLYLSALRDVVLLQSWSTGKSDFSTHSSISSSIWKQVKHKRLLLVLRQSENEWKVWMLKIANSFRYVTVTSHWVTLQTVPVTLSLSFTFTLRPCPHVPKQSSIFLCISATSRTFASEWTLCKQLDRLHTPGQ